MRRPRKELYMKIDLAPYVPQIREKFCPDQWVSEEERGYIWVRNRATGQLEVSSYATGEKKYNHVTSSKKVLQSYILRNTSNYELRAIAIVNEGAEGNVNVGGWNVSLIDAQTDFGVQLIKSALFVLINDESNTAHFVANIGGGYVVTAAEYLQEKSRRSWEEKLAREGQLPQLQKRISATKTEYSFTAVDIERRLPFSPANPSYASSSKPVRVLQVYTLLSREMKIYLCAVIDKRCGWLRYNPVGCCEYKFASQICTVTDRFTTVKEDLQLGAKLLSNQGIGGTILVNQKPFLIVNIGGGRFELHHKEWEEEKQEIERRLKRRFDESW